jgi:hypothetical protein
MATGRSIARFGGGVIAVPMTPPTQQPAAVSGQTRDRTGGFGLSLAPARAELSSAVTTGRISLSVLLAITLGLIAFYYGTRSVQGGG